MIALDVLEWVLSRVGGLDTGQTRSLLRDTSSLSETLATVPGGWAAATQNAFDMVTARATPFRTYIDEYQETKRDGKTLDQAISGINKFVTAVPESIESLTGGHVQAWLYGLKSEKTGKPADQGTKQRRLSDLRQYWKHLVAMGHVSEERPCPFDNRITSNKETESEAQERERVGFKTSDVPALWKQAEVENDSNLAALIKLGAYTGARLSEIMNLTTDAVMEAEGVRCIHIKIGKTRAARRMVPIHPAIQPLIDDLVKAALPDGKLISSNATDPAAAILKRFSRLKDDMGYDEKHVFHSLRHTVIQALRESGCNLEVRNRIVGHEDTNEKTNTGADYGDFSPAGKLAALVKAIQYPV